jgi:hypothetical protein
MRALPKSIEELMIYDTWPNVATQLQQVLTHRQTKFSDLKSVDIRAWKNASRRTQRPLKAPFKDAGIDLKIVNVIRTSRGSRTTPHDDAALETDDDSLKDEYLNRPSSTRQLRPENPFDVLSDHDGGRSAFKRARIWMYRTAEEFSGPEEFEEYPGSLSNDGSDDESDEDTEDLRHQVRKIQKPKMMTWHRYLETPCESTLCSNMLRVAALYLHNR